MSDDTIYDRVSKLEDEVAKIKEDVDLLKMLLKNRIAKFEIQKVKDSQ